MSNYEKTEKLNDVMKNICERIVSYYSIKDDGSSVEDAYYLIDQNDKPVMVVTICRKVNNADYKEKAIFYIDADDTSKLFLMDINYKVIGGQIPSMAFDSFEVLYDIFDCFAGRYGSYKRYLACRGNDELEKELEQRKVIYNEGFKKGYMAGVRGH